jgi:hypothetical protein
MFSFLNYNFIIVKNLHTLYNKKSTSLIVKSLTLYKCYEIFINGLFKAITSCNNKSYIWIYIFNSKVGITTRFSNSHLYKKLDIESAWTPIEALAKEIRIGKNQIHLIT